MGFLPPHEGEWICPACAWINTVDPKVPPEKRTCEECDGLFEDPF